MATAPNNPSPTAPAKPAAAAVPAAVAPANAKAQVTTNPVAPALTRAMVLADIRVSEARIMQAIQAMEQRMSAMLTTVKQAVAPTAPAPLPQRATFARAGTVSAPGPTPPAAPGTKT
jgi:hypothetical protein